MARWYEQWADPGLKVSASELQNYDPTEVFGQRIESLSRKLMVLLIAERIPARVRGVGDGKQDKKFLKVAINGVDRMVRSYRSVAEEYGLYGWPDVVRDKAANRAASLLNQEDFLADWSTEIETRRRHMATVAQRRGSKDLDRIVNRLCRLMGDEDKEIERIERKAQ